MAFSVDTRVLGTNKNVYNVYTSGSGAISETFQPNHDFTIVGIRLHLSAAGGAGTFTAQVDSELGAAFDNVLISQDMTSVSDINWFLDPTNILLGYSRSEKIVFSYANSNNRTWGLQVTYYKNNSGQIGNLNF